MEYIMATRIDAFQDWRRELEAVEQEMDRLIAAGLPASVEERQARQNSVRSIGRATRSCGSQSASVGLRQSS